MTNTLAFIGGLGGPEIAVIFIIVLLLFGAKKIPELARGLGKSMGEFKRARDDFEDITRNVLATDVPCPARAANIEPLTLPQSVEPQSIVFTDTGAIGCLYRTGISG